MFDSTRLRVFREVVERGRVLAAGMGLPGPIDRASGLVHSQPILPSWVGLNPAGEMEARLELPVR